MASISDYFRDPVELEELVSHLAARYLLLPGAKRTSELERCFAAYVRGRNDVQIIIPEGATNQIRIDWSKAQDPLRARLEFQREFFTALGNSFALVPQIHSPISHAGANHDRQALKSLTATLDASSDTLGMDGVVHPHHENGTLRKAYIIFDDHLRTEILRKFADIEYRESERFFERAEASEARKSAPRGKREPNASIYDVRTSVASLRAAFALNGVKMRANDAHPSPEPESLQGLLQDLSRITRTNYNRARTDAGLRHLVDDFAHWRLARRFTGSALHIDANANTDVSLANKSMEIELSRATTFVREAHTLLEHAEPQTKALLESQIEQANQKIGQLRASLAGAAAIDSAVRESTTWRSDQVEFARRDAFDLETRGDQRLQLEPDHRYGDLMEETDYVKARIDTAYESLLLGEDPTLAPMTLDTKLAAYDTMRAMLAAREELPDILDAYPATATMSVIDPQPQYAAMAARIVAGNATETDHDAWNKALALQLPIDAVHAAEWDRTLVDALPNDLQSDVALLIAMLRTGNIEHISSMVRAGTPAGQSLATILADGQPSTPTPEGFATLAGLLNKIRTGEAITTGHVRAIAIEQPAVLAFARTDNRSAEDIATSLIANPHDDRVHIDPARLYDHVAGLPIVQELTQRTDPGLVDRVVEATIRGSAGRIDKHALGQALRQRGTNPLDHIDDPVIRENTTVAYLASRVRRAASIAERDIRGLDARIGWTQDQQMIAQLQAQRAKLLQAHPYLRPELVDERLDPRSAAHSGMSLHVTRGRNERFGLPLVSERQNIVSSCAGDVTRLHALVSTNDGKRIFTMPITAATDLRFDAREFSQTQSISAFKIGSNLSVLAVPLAIVTNDSRQTAIPVAQIERTSYANDATVAFGDDPSLMLMAAYYTGSPVKLNALGARPGISLHLPQLQRGELRLHDQRIAHALELLHDLNDVALRKGVAVDRTQLDKSLRRYFEAPNDAVIQTLNRTAGTDVIAHATQLVTERGLQGIEPKTLHRARTIWADHLRAGNLDQLLNAEPPHVQPAIATAIVIDAATNAVASTVTMVDTIDRMTQNIEAGRQHTIIVANGQLQNVPYDRMGTSDTMNMADLTGGEILNRDDALAWLQQERANVLASRPYVSAIEPLPLPSRQEHEHTPALRRADVHTHPVPQLLPVTFTDREAPRGFVWAEQRPESPTAESIWHRIPVDVAPRSIPSTGFVRIDPQPFSQALVYSTATQALDPLARAYEHATLEYVRTHLHIPTDKKLVLLDANEVARLPESSTFQLAAFDDRSAYYVGPAKLDGASAGVVPILEIAHTRPNLQMDPTGVVMKPNARNEAIKDPELRLPTKARFEIRRTDGGAPTLIINPDVGAREGYIAANRLAIQIADTESPDLLKRRDDRHWGVIGIDQQLDAVVLGSDPTTGNGISSFGPQHIMLRSVPLTEFEHPEALHEGDIIRLGRELHKRDPDRPTLYRIVREGDDPSAAMRIEQPDRVLVGLRAR